MSRGLGDVYKRQDFEFGIDFGRDTHQLAGPFERTDIFGKILIHGFSYWSNANLRNSTRITNSIRHKSARTPPSPKRARSGIFRATGNGHVRHPKQYPTEIPHSRPRAAKRPADSRGFREPIRAAPFGTGHGHPAVPTRQWTSALPFHKTRDTRPSRIPFARAPSPRTGFPECAGTVQQAPHRPLPRPSLMLFRVPIVFRREILIRRQNVRSPDPSPLRFLIPPSFAPVRNPVSSGNVRLPAGKRRPLALLPRRPVPPAAGTVFEQRPEEKNLLPERSNVPLRFRREREDRFRSTGPDNEKNRSQRGPETPHLNDMPRTHPRRQANRPTANRLRENPSHFRHRHVTAKRRPGRENTKGQNTKKPFALRTALCLLRIDPTASLREAECCFSGYRLCFCE